MSEQDETRESIRTDIHGNVSGQVATGKHITQSQRIIGNQVGLTQEELEELRRSFAQLKTQVEAEAPPEKKDAALERVGELEEAVTAKKPDLTTMEYVRKWFLKNLPKLAGVVTTVVVHPYVGKAVEAAGEMAADEFRHRFGAGDSSPS